MLPMIYLLALIPSSLTLFAAIVFVAIGSRESDDPSALLPSIAGLAMLAVSGVIWFPFQPRSLSFTTPITGPLDA